MKHLDINESTMLVVEERIFTFTVCGENSVMKLEFDEIEVKEIIKFLKECGVSNE